MRRELLVRSERVRCAPTFVARSSETVMPMPAIASPSVFCRSALKLPYR